MKGLGEGRDNALGVSRDGAVAPGSENSEEAAKIRVDLGEGCRETLGREVDLSGLLGPHLAKAAIRPDDESRGCGFDVRSGVMTQKRATGPVEQRMPFSPLLQA